MSTPAPFSSDPEYIQKLKDIVATASKDAPPIKDFPQEKYLAYLESLKSKAPPLAVREVAATCCCPWNCKKGV
jgi:hypothetical protein